MIYFQKVCKYQLKKKKMDDLLATFTRICNWSIMDWLSIIVLLMVTLSFVGAIVLWFLPGLLVTIYVRFTILTSYFQQKYMKLDRTTTCSYIERGTIESTLASVLFLHGFSGSRVDFVNIAPFLNTAYHLVAVDYLNHGNSSIQEKPNMTDMVSFLKKFVEKSGLYRRKFHLVGYSFGGAISTSYTAIYPEDIASLVLISPYINVDFVNKSLDSSKFLESNEDLQRLLDTWSSGKMKPLPGYMLTALRQYKGWCKQAHSFVSENMFMPPNVFNLSAEILEKISSKVLVIWGDSDKFCLPEGAEYLKEHLSSSKLEYIEGAGHSVLVTHLEQLLKIMVEWLSDQTVERLVPLTQGMKKGKVY